MQVVSRRRTKREGDATPEASRRSSRKARSKASGTSSIDTKDHGGEKATKSAPKSTLCGDVSRFVIHLMTVICAMFGAMLVAEYLMLNKIEWDKPKVEEPKLMQYFGASFITKDFDCSILTRRCYMAKRGLRTCFVPSLMCNSMLRPDMFPPEEKNRFYYVNIRHVTSQIDDLGKKKEVFRTFHDKIKHPFILSRLKLWSDTFAVPLTNSKGMPKDNQLFFTPWEILDSEEKYKKNLDFVDLNMDRVLDCIQPKMNTDIGRRDWIQNFALPVKEDALPKAEYFRNYWSRDTTQKTERIRVDTVPGFTGAFVKKIIEVATGILDDEIAHSTRGQHIFTDDSLLLIYHHVLIHALRNPFGMLFRTKKWQIDNHYKHDDLENVVINTESVNYENMPDLTDVGSSMSFLFGAHAPNVGTKIPDTLAVTISQAGTKLGGKDFDLNVPIRIGSGLTHIEIVSSAQGERAFHANIIAALRMILRLRLYKDDKPPDFNDVLHIPMTFFSMEDKKMVFDRYNIQTPLRDLLCKNIQRCATPYDQNTIDWQTRFNGTTAIQYSSNSKMIMSRVDTTQDKRNYAVGF